LGWFLEFKSGVKKSGIEQLISNKLGLKKYIGFFVFKIFFGCANFNLKHNTATIFSESAEATKFRIDHQISNKRALNLYINFIRLLK